MSGVKWNLLGDTSSVDQNVDLAVVIGDILDSLVNGIGVTDVDPVETHVDAGLLRQLAGRLVTKLLLDVQNGNALDADFRKGLSHVVSKSASTTVSKVSKVK